MQTLVHALGVVGMLWMREVKRFLREPVRLVGMFGQPLLYLFIVGNGFAASFRPPSGGDGFDYITFMYPGILGMTVLFTSVFSGVSVIWEREFGFLKEVLVAPVPRWTLVAGKALGGSTTATFQGAILLLLAPVIGIRLSALQVVELLLLIFLLSFSLCGFGLAVASRMTSMEGFHMIMNFLVMPMFFLSGALFPLEGAPAWLAALMHLDPLTYGVDALRGILYLQDPAARALLQFPMELNLAVVAGVGLVLILFGAVAFSTQE